MQIVSPHLEELHGGSGRVDEYHAQAPGGIQRTVGAIPVGAEFNERPDRHRLVGGMRLHFGAAGGSKSEHFVVAQGRLQPARLNRCRSQTYYMENS